MVRKRVQKSSERSPQPQESAIAPVGARSHSPSSHTQRDMETQEIQQHKHEATTLEIQAKYGTITPQGQERLTFLQAKMADYTQRKLDFANRVYQHMYNSSGGNSSVTPSERKIAPPIQAKLTIGQPGDKYEQEADRVAAQVVKQIHAPTTQRQALPEDEQQKKPAIGSIQRQSMPEDEELQMKPSGAGMTAPQDLETSIQQARGSGQSLADSIKQPMEQAFGADFSGVKVHTDARSDQLNQSIQARAFTTGQDVFFRQGEYNPGSREGQELLAHELTHVVQQNGGAVQRSQVMKMGGGEDGGEHIPDDATIIEQVITYIQGLQFEYNNDGDCGTLVDKALTFAKQINNKVDTKMMSQTNYLLVEPGQIKGDNRTSNTEGLPYWFFERHYWCKIGNTEYDPLFNTKGSPTLDESTDSTRHKELLILKFNSGKYMVYAPEVKNQGVQNFVSNDLESVKKYIDETPYGTNYSSDSDYSSDSE